VKLEDSGIPYATNNSSNTLFAPAPKPSDAPTDNGIKLVEAKVGGSRTFSFGFKITKAGEDVLSFINGDASKVDDGIANIKQNTNENFSVADIKWKLYSSS